MPVVTLIDGSHVDSASEDWRHECEARAIAARPSLQQRRDYLEAIEKRRGAAAAQRLRATMKQIWEARKR